MVNFRHLIENYSNLLHQRKLRYFAISIWSKTIEKTKSMMVLENWVGNIRKTTFLCCDWCGKMKMPKTDYKKFEAQFCVNLFILINSSILRRTIFLQPSPSEKLINILWWVPPILRPSLRTHPIPHFLRLTRSFLFVCQDSSESDSQMFAIFVNKNLRAEKIPSYTN